jgi:hypothetical protein
VEVFLKLAGLPRVEVEAVWKVLVIDLPETCFAEVHPSWEFYLSKLFLEKVC